MDSLISNKVSTCLGISSKQLESAVPSSKISSLSSGEFVGMVADEPENKIELKTFHCEILNDHKSLKEEEDNY